MTDRVNNLHKRVTVFEILYYGFWNHTDTEVLGFLSVHTGEDLDFPSVYV